MQYNKFNEANNQSKKLPTIDWLNGEYNGGYDE
jgi:hypothetical protein